MNSCDTCALKKTCIPYAQLPPFTKRLIGSKGERTGFPPPCGGALYVKAEPRPSRMRSFEQFKPQKPVEEKPAAPRRRTLDDIDF